MLLKKLIVNKQDLVVQLKITKEKIIIGKEIKKIKMGILMSQIKIRKEKVTFILNHN